MRSHWLSEYSLSTENEQRLEKLYQEIQKESEHFLGYPCSSVFDYSALYRFLQFPLNNAGDPYLPSNYHLNTHDFECEVISIFQQLAQAPAGTTWGYVTNGGTEGNHYGLFLSRELFPEGMVYYSQDAHYSIDKILRCLNLHSIMIRSQPNGCMDLEDLREALRIHRDIPPIVCATIGTTMKGAVDDILGIQEIFKDLALSRHYLHADAALGGMILPFMDNPPPWNFTSGIDSISISGHKMIGSPIPCGIVLAKKRNVDRIAQSVEYIGTLDTTLSGSRNAITPLFLWYAFQTIGVRGFKDIIPRCLQVADYSIQELNKLDHHAWRHPYSNTVVFDRPPAPVTQNWQIACQGSLSHLIAMPHVTVAHIDRFMADIRAAQPQIIARSQPFTACETLAENNTQEIIIVGGTDGHLLTDVSAALASVGISIEGLIAVKVEEGTMLRLRVNDRDRALQILNQTLDIGRCYGQSRPFNTEEAAQILSQVEYQAVSGDALLVELEDKAGSLATLMKKCHEKQISIRSVRLLWRGKEKAIVELASAEPTQLKAMLADQALTSELVDLSS
ncbi:histidine decarboxylase [Synechococcales cyanobacterium C]|uniref:Histidine decarboxylase n=1 Tax=Petrachloros mirabilis ULC683 TaxID=2781853 RepID=A0A8K1ZX00_9CYAN|nr:histidine decarboxylase [Petrachloros mirabilis]NCJ05637.1 histidine decarboxylase [Petrachloros mirabilis ULC683]